MRIYDESAIGELSDSFNVNVGVAVDLADGGLDSLAVYNQSFIGDALSEEASRDGKNKSEPHEKKKIAVFVHHLRPPGLLLKFEISSHCTPTPNRRPSQMSRILHANPIRDSGDLAGVENGKSATQSAFDSAAEWADCSAEKKGAAAGPPRL